MSSALPILQSPIEEDTYKAQKDRACDATASTCAVSINYDDKASTHNSRMLNAATSNHSTKSIPTDIIIEVNEDEVLEADSHIISTDTRSTTAIAITSSSADSYLQDSSDFSLVSGLDENIVLTMVLNDVKGKTHARRTTRKDDTNIDADNLFRPRKSELCYLHVAFAEYFNVDDNEEMDED